MADDESKYIDARSSSVRALSDATSGAVLLTASSTTMFADDFSRSDF
jgi:hypothetical protein